MKHAGTGVAAFVWLLGMGVSAPMFAQTDPKSKAIQEDIMDHRTMAEAHRKAAECLEAGRPEKECHAQLAKDCRGVGIGRTCGMRHRHRH